MTAYYTYYGTSTSQINSGEEISIPLVSKYERWTGKPRIFLLSAVPYYITSLLKPLFAADAYGWQQLGVSASVALILSGMCVCLATENCRCEFISNCGHSLHGDAVPATDVFVLRRGTNRHETILRISREVTTEWFKSAPARGPLYRCWDGRPGAHSLRRDEHTSQKFCQSSALSQRLLASSLLNGQLQTD